MDFCFQERIRLQSRVATKCCPELVSNDVVHVCLTNVAYAPGKWAYMLRLPRLQAHASLARLRFNLLKLCVNGGLKQR